MTTKMRVLVIDDDRDVVESVCIRLGAAGYQTLFAFDGREGVDSAIENNPDAIVLDVRMPELDGMGALAELKQHPVTREIPVVMLSASLVDQHAALRVGASYFVIKPYSPTNLIAALESAIRQSAYAG